MCQLSVVLAPSAKQSLKEAIYYESVAFTISSTYSKCKHFSNLQALTVKRVERFPAAVQAL